VLTHAPGVAATLSLGNPGQERKFLALELEGGPEGSPFSFGERDASGQATKYFALF
jgi:hypothetical protein